MESDNSSITVSSDTLRLVYAFLYTHSKPKLAAKFAEQYPKMELTKDADRAETLSNALVATVASASALPDSKVSLALGSKKKKSRTHDAKEKKSKKAKKEPVVAEAETQASVLDPDVTMEDMSLVQDGSMAEPEVSITEVIEPGEVSLVESVASPVSKSNKKTKTVGERFQRVKSDRAEILDERLRDMSYAAKSGAGDYGARANADLIVTRGKAFTKEKNKKKRGSYRGGEIDQGSQYVV
ncbi:jun-like transcription factor [Malassezia psittaci]|uniref:Jun-like transcription factor n=1 Tax=Malassezia psittaci TaxID=1821823 RepID=A0AAF0FAW6_9BASI|nr:jun-like transcription factor [Malassezia psittaci]